jgi:hypothetical protein
MAKDDEKVGFTLAQVVAWGATTLLTLLVVIGGWWLGGVNQHMSKMDDVHPKIESRIRSIEDWRDEQKKFNEQVAKALVDRDGKILQALEDIKLHQKTGGSGK